MNQELLAALKTMYQAFGVDALKGCTHDWTGYENGNGQPVGKKLQAAIKKAKKVIDKSEPK